MSASPAIVTHSASAELRFRYATYLGDTSLILAQRLGEWVGHAPALEEDLALANIALDLLGQARYLLSYAGEIEGKGRSEDDLAFLRDPSDFSNLALVEQPNVDFGHTIVRQFLLDAWQLELFEKLQASSEPRFAELAAKALKETRYHYRFSAGWVVRLGDGTEESHNRVQAGLDALWRFTSEMFAPGAADEEAAAAGLGPDPASLRAAWLANVEQVLQTATLKRPADVPFRWFGKRHQHTDHLSHLLAEMQFMQRTYPGAQW
ncbi:phenylacetate-CoA oxygenase subunit PaaC [Steroidobacter sp. S1-65]|uniref:Phenylacetate-CoA oxygenase subunit PaaC n=1 Tax=Steroidobacter gossypii TaxID=2805490 RepID=A0ABS1WWK7_9GAMM|nr:1,2-phenylacetyl-CoA epoxidase subunit PaaC [Steroidobacter gossypii]MBM0105343.1 phenylacetate-CoA oxygenase subunit PaaC [Steroidobacter gossypii]